MSGAFTLPRPKQRTGYSLRDDDPSQEIRDKHLKEMIEVQDGFEDETSQTLANTDFDRIASHIDLGTSFTNQGEKK